MNDDISAILYRIKENISAVENGQEDNIVLQEIEADYLRLLELIKLFLISERGVYYGYFLMNMSFKANFCSESIAGIKLNEYPPVLEANPLLLCKFTLKEIIYVVCHEIDHVVLNHPAEMVKANPEKDEETFKRFNLAADAAVNDRINSEIKSEKHLFMTPPKGIITSKSLGKMFCIKNILPMENYAYYFGLIKDKDGKNKLQNGASSVMQQNQGEQDTEQVGGESNDNGEETADIAEESNKIVTAKNCKEIKDHDWDAGEDKETATENVKQLVNSASNMINSENRGLMPANFIAQIEKINEPPKISWQKVLKKYVGTISTNKRKTRTRLNRRQPERFDISGAMDDKVLKIVVAIDTSGSVSDEMISGIFNEIFDILAKRKHDITVIECDAEVQRVYKAKNRSEIKTKVWGRGGTEFTPVIEYINKEKQYRDALLIYFTDGFGESKIPKPKTYRNIWVVYDNEKNLSLAEPYGIVLSL